jgi:hypothetical protein
MRTFIVPFICPPPLYIYCVSFFCSFYLVPLYYRNIMTYFLLNFAGYNVTFYAEAVSSYVGCMVCFCLHTNLYGLQVAFKARALTQQFTAVCWPPIPSATPYTQLNTLLMSSTSTSLCITALSTGPTSATTSSTLNIPQASKTPSMHLLFAFMWFSLFSYLIGLVVVASATANSSFPVSSASLSKQSNSTSISFFLSCFYASFF